LGALASLLLFAAGLLLWTGLEYLLHRFAFHGFAPHWQHHLDPKDPEFILAPLGLSLPVSGALWLLFALLARSTAVASLIMAGVIAGYLAYEVVHRRIHGAAPGGPLLRALRRHHFYHHFASDSVCFGVTSPFWDLVAGSLPVSQRSPDAG
jgi:sterol desaturase/sphingolipid hydroxylase (fatty acid hydroxylase superfamily)